MSLFPRKIQRGQSVTIHVRIESRDNPVFENFKVVVIDPNGKSIEIANQNIIALKESLIKKNGNEVFLENPPALFAEYLSQEGFDGAAAIDFFKRSAKSTNYFFSFKASAKAPLGRYEVQLFVTDHGQIQTSSTRKFDFFHVEEFKVLQFSKMKRGQLLRLKNQSPEKIKIQLWEIPDLKTGLHHFKHKFVLIPKKSDRKIITFSRKVLLSYFPYTEIFRVSLSGEPFVERSKKYLYKDDKKKRMTKIYILEKTKMQLVQEFKGFEREIWINSTGLNLRSELTTAGKNASYKKMLTAGFLLEMPAENKL